MNSPIGQLFVGASPAGLAMVEFDRGHSEPSPNVVTRDAEGKKIRIIWEPSSTATRPYEKELNEYFSGKRREFSFPLDLRGTDFQKRCWRALLEIPYGETCNYRDIAQRVETIGFRAVGMANHSNPVPIVVPCHRVIKSDGRIGNYGGGVERKLKLLRAEGFEVDRGDRVPPQAVGADPFEHPDAQRRFRVMSNVEELQRALEFP